MKQNWIKERERNYFNDVWNDMIEKLKHGTEELVIWMNPKQQQKTLI